MDIGSLVWVGAHWVSQFRFSPLLGRNGGMDIGLTLRLCVVDLVELRHLSMGGLRFSGGRFVWALAYGYGLGLLLADMRWLRGQAV
ncbi:hypothetical protein U1Q18_020097 [Sarracenia purpurea var. burkii]